MSLNVALWIMSIMLLIVPLQGYPRPQNEDIDSPTIKSSPLVPQHLQDMVLPGRNIEGHQLEDLVLQHMMAILQKSAASNSEDSKSGTRTEEENRKQLSNKEAENDERPRTTKKNRIEHRNIELGRDTTSKKPKSDSDNRKGIHNTRQPLETKYKIVKNSNSVGRTKSEVVTSKITKPVHSHFVAQTHAYTNRRVQKTPAYKNPRKISDRKTSSKSNKENNEEVKSDQPNLREDNGFSISENANEFSKVSKIRKYQQAKTESELEYEGDDKVSHPAFIVLNSQSRSRYYKPSKSSNSKTISSDDLNLFLPILTADGDDEPEFSRIEISDILVDDEGLPFQFRFHDLNDVLKGYVTDLNQKRSQDIIAKLSKFMFDDSDEDNSSSSSEEDDDDDFDEESRFSSYDINLERLYNNPKLNYKSKDSKSYPISPNLYNSDRISSVPQLSKEVDKPKSTSLVHSSQLFERILPETFVAPKENLKQKITEKKSRISLIHKDLNASFISKTEESTTKSSITTLNPVQITPIQFNDSNFPKFTVPNLLFSEKGVSQSSIGLQLGQPVQVKRLES